MQSVSSLPSRLHFETKTLRHLSDESLMTRMDSLACQERHLTLNVVTSLIEVDRRKLYLPYGYPSLFAYCVRRLGYSEPAALRRIRSARLIGEHPEVYGQIERGELTLTTVSKLHGVLTLENRKKLHLDVGGKPQREVDVIIARLRPERAAPDRVRAVGVWTRTLAEGCKQSYRRSDGQKLTTSDGEDVEPCCRIEFTASREFMEKVENLKALLWYRYPYGMSFETLFELVVDAYAERHDPDKRQERRRKINEKKKQKAAQHIKKQPSSRHVPVKIRDEVHARDGGRCTYVAKDGTRCGATSGPQIDHVKPFGRGGGHHAGNLRLLCGKHNRLEAERTYGPAHMRRFKSDNRRPRL